MSEPAMISSPDRPAGAVDGPIDLPGGGDRRDPTIDPTILVDC